MKLMLATAVMLSMTLPMITLETETKIPITNISTINITVADEYGGCSSDENSSLNHLIIYGKVSM